MGDGLRSTAVAARLGKSLLAAATVLFLLGPISYVASHRGPGAWFENGAYMGPFFALCSFGATWRNRSLRVLPSVIIDGFLFVVAWMVMGVKLPPAPAWMVVSHLLVRVFAYACLLTAAVAHSFIVDATVEKTDPPGGKAVVFSLVAGLAIAAMSGWSIRSSPVLVWTTMVLLIFMSFAGGVFLGFWGALHLTRFTAGIEPGLKAVLLTLRHSLVLRIAPLAYIFVGFVFAASFFAIEIRWPGSIKMASSGPATGAGEFVYFSFTTLSTVGYGDYLPTWNLPRFLAIAEAILGLILSLLIAGDLLKAFTGPEVPKGDS